MRILHFIYALYITALSVYPCSDAETCLDEQLTVTEKVNVANHKHTANEPDLCTPFCICACCATHARISAAPEIACINLIHYTQVLTPYLEKEIVNNSFTVWQPPKIS